MIQFDFGHLLFNVKALPDLYRATLTKGRSRVSLALSGRP